MYIWLFAGVMYNKINSVKNDISDVDVWGKFTLQSMDK